MSLLPFSKLMEKVSRLIEKEKEVVQAEEKRSRPPTDGQQTPQSMRKDVKERESLRERRKKTKLNAPKTNLKNTRVNISPANKNGKGEMITTISKGVKDQESSKKRIRGKNKKLPLLRAPNAREERVKLCASTVEKGVKALQEEYAKLKATAQTEPVDASAFMDPANADKIRYKDIFCLEATRVHLKNNEFIHANYVKTEFNPKRFICTQAPLDNTVRTFWTMLLDEETEAILMLCNFVENDCKKCAVYYPPKAQQTLTFGDIKVVNTHQYPLTDEPSILVSVLSVKVVSTNQRHVVKHYQWTNWPDKGDFED